METSNNRLRRLLRSRLDSSGKVQAPPLDLALGVLAKDHPCVAASRSLESGIKEFRAALEGQYELTRQMNEQLMALSSQTLPSYQEDPKVPALLKRQAG